jgi:hypothetical protein
MVRIWFALPAEGRPNCALVMVETQLENTG